MKARDSKDRDRLIAQLQEEVKQHRQEIDDLNHDLLEKNDLVLAYQEAVNAGRQQCADLLIQERAEKHKWKQAYAQEREKTEQLESEIARYQLSKYDSGFVDANDHRANQPADESQEQKEDGPLWTSDYMKDW